MRALALSLFFSLCCNAVRLDRRQPRLLAARATIETTVQNQAAENPCRASPLDFVFVIDSSRSIRPHEYEKVKTFIISLLQFLEIGPDATRVGLIQYGSEVQPEFSLKTFTTKAEVEQAVRKMKHLATGTMTGLAIQYTMERSFREEDGARPEYLRIPRIAMIVTDGRPQDEVEEIAAQARQAGIQIFAIGVGRVDMNTLKTMGSEPHTEHVHLVANFSQMETLISVYQSKFCGEIDFCDLGDHGCEHDCVTIPASYICRCKKGYVLNPDGKTCSKIDHCADGTHGCEQEFMNTEDACACNCRRGFTLRPDGKTCERIDHCADGTHGCEQDFMNTEDTCVCKCREGFTLRTDGKTCQELDPCADRKHGCEQEFVSAGDSCVCKCRDGFILRPDGKTCQKSECRSGALDLVFVIDGSKSLGPANFKLVKQFVNSIVDSLDVSRTGTRVGLLQYSTNVRAEFTLSQYASAQEVQRAVSQVQYMGRGSMTGSALRHMFEFSFTAKEGARPDIPRVSVVFTDGRSQDDVSEWANKAKTSGVTIYAVGVGKAIEQELREIASEPDEKHLYYAQDFKDMGEITQKLKSRMCTDKPLDESMCQCGNVVRFQNQVTEKLENLVQNIEALSKRLESLENHIRQK
ncbi:matrilin-4-like isoform X2 [Nelusetta ayraudi]|uniref:matrilin-4-like isoform X2 n=1 Tax=Nelusetta ayraudi TaxID=303726 RepID=UPI003F6E79BB